MTGRYKEMETGAEYYVRVLPDGTVAWVGEAVATSSGRKSFTNVFLGRPVSDGVVQGDFIDVPKGRAQGVFRGIRVQRITRGFSFDLPGVGRRTLGPPDVDLPLNDSVEWGAGFYDEPTDTPPYRLTGVWRCSDGGTYYLREAGGTVVWFGEHPSMGWSNVFFGTRSGNMVSGRWIDVPKGRATGSGQIQVEIASPPLVSELGALARETILMRRSVTGGFGGAEWNKTDSLRIAFLPRTLTIIRNVDTGGLNRAGDEPYLIPLYVTLGGDQYPTPADLVTPTSRSRPRFESPLMLNDWGRRGDWPKNNLTWREDLPPATALRIPEYVGYGETALRTLPGLQPNSVFARLTANYFPAIIAMEEASTRNDDVRAALLAVLNDGPTITHQILARDVATALAAGEIDLPATIAAIRRALTERVTDAVRRSALSDLFGILGGLDPDKFVGAWFPGVSFGMLRDQAALPLAAVSLPHEFTFRGVPVWRLETTISAALGPPRFAAEATEMEICFLTGSDGKRATSRVRVEVQAVPANRGPFAVHGAREVFPDYSLHTTRIALDPPLPLGNQRALIARWQRDPGGGFDGPDTWRLDRIRVAVFDRLGRRQLLLPNRALNVALSIDQALTIPLPPA
jgi:hypothetical protein